MVFNFGGAATSAAPTAAAPAPSSGTSTFSFGSTPVATPASTSTSTSGAPAPGNVGGFSFGGTTSAPSMSAPSTSTLANPSTNASAPVTTPQTTTLSTTPTSQASTTPTATCSIPDYEDAFPHVRDYLQVENLLMKISNPTSSTQEVVFYGQELMHLLKVVTNGTVKDNIGAGLAQPQPLKHQPGPNETFRQKLQAHPFVSFSRNDSNDSASTDATPVELPQSMLQSIFQLSTELNLPETEAASLYGAIATTFQGLDPSKDDVSAAGLVSQEHGSSTSDEDMERGTLHYFAKMNRPNSTEATVFCAKAVSKAKLNGTYAKSLMDTNSMTSDGSDSSMGNSSLSGKRLLDLARELYFWERGYLLKTLLTLIQFRVSCCSDVHNSKDEPSQEEKIDSEAYGWNPNAPRELLVQRIVLEASDQLLQNDLIRNLVVLVREMNLKNEEVTKKISSVLEREHQEQEGSNGLTGSGAPFTSMFGSSSIAAPTPLGVVAATATSTMPPLQDMDYAFQEFTFQQREMASKCLFYLTYNTQCTCDEVVSIIDVIQELTNGNPQLLQCVMALLLSATCSMEGKHVLMNRDIHGPNTFGVGNALISLNQESMLASYGEMKNIITRLVPTQEGFPAWKQQDVVGVLSAAFALLLCPAVSNSNTTMSNIRTTFRSCLEAPMMTKSITFARLSLLPCIGKTSTASSASTIANLDRDFAFFMSVLSEFTSKYLDTICSFGDIPVSRARWMSYEVQELQLRQVREDQRRQVSALCGQFQQDNDIPSEVDITKRPDCLDDIIELVVSMCSKCPDCAGVFWSTTMSLVPSSAIDDLADDKLGEKGKMLMKLKPSRIMKKLERLHEEDPSLLPSYLSFLATLALAGAPDDNNPSGNGAVAVHDWLSDNERLNLSPKSSDTDKKVDWVYVLNVLRWYSDQLAPDVNKANTTFAIGVTNAEESTSYYYGTDSSDFPSSGTNEMNRTTSTSLSDGKNKLNEDSAVMIMSLLNLLSNASSISDAVKVNIIQTKLQSRDKFGSEDDVVTILFSLLMKPVTPDIRGLILTTIANLVRCENIQEVPKEVQETLVDINRRSWECIELCQLIPIPRQQKVEEYSESLSILHEIEHVECKAGYYPFAEGFLKLLTALISTVGCPSDLGKDRLSRPGCTPYIEFILYFLLPRMLGKGCHGRSLHFNTTTDKVRLYARALEVINAVLVAYSNDSSEQSQNGSTDSTSTTPSTPDAKGPGLYVLAEMLSSSGTISSALTQILLDEGGTMQCMTSDDDCGIWKESCILLVLRILCAVAEHENKFIDTLPPAKKIQVPRLAEYLLGSSTLQTMKKAEVVPSIAQLVGYEAGHLKNEEGIATFALKLVTYLLGSTAPKDYVQALNGRNGCHEANVSVAFARRMISARKNQLKPAELEMHDVILKSLLQNMKVDTFGSENFSHVVLGLSGQALQNRMSIFKCSTLTLEYGTYHNGLDAILELLSDVKFVLGYDTSALAAKCYEIIYRLCEPRGTDESSASWELRICVMAKLRSLGFWKNHLVRFLGRSKASDSILHLIISSSPLSGTNQEDITDTKESACARSTSYLHSMSWLLKAISIELQALMGIYQPNQQQITGLSPGAKAFLSPKPSLCRDLLEVLLGNTTVCPILEDALKEIPIHELPVARELVFDAPTQTVLKTVSRPLDGPEEVCSHYQEIDVAELEVLIESADMDAIVTGICNSRKVAMLEWAGKWNNYVKFECSISHFATAWSLLLRTTVTFCPSVLFFDGEMKQQNFVDKKDLLNLLKLLLAGLNSSSNQNELQARCCLPLSLACAPLLELNLRLHGKDTKIHMRQRQVGDSFSFMDCDELVQLISLTTGAIANCNWSTKTRDPHHDERAALLNCSLSMIIEYSIQIGAEVSMPTNLSVQFYSNALKCARYLLMLSSCPISDDDPSQDIRSTVISRTARSGLSSLIIWFEMQQNEYAEKNHDGIFLCELFSSQPGTEGEKTLSDLINLLIGFDSTISSLLETIASCRQGTNLLVEGGITNALLTASRKVSKQTETKLMDQMSSEGYGKIEMEPSIYQKSHLKLINVMLASPSSVHMRQRLISESMNYIEMNYDMCNRLLQRYPQNGDFTMALITCIHLIASESERGIDGIRFSNSWNNLVQSIMQLAFHLGQFPLPSVHMLALPSQLRQERNHCWWDSINLNTVINGNARHDTIGENWSDEMYTFALNGAQTLEMSLMVLMVESRISASHYLKVDGISIAKALCQLSSVANAVEAQIKRYDTSNEAGITSLLGSAAIGAEMQVDTRKCIDIDRLKELGSTFGRCVEQLLTMSLNLSKTFLGMRKDDMKTFTSPILHGELKMMKFYCVPLVDLSQRLCTPYFIKCFLQALFHVNVESKGVGCTSNHVGPLAAKQLRMVLDEHR